MQGKTSRVGRLCRGYATRRMEARTHAGSRTLVPSTASMTVVTQYGEDILAFTCPADALIECMQTLLLLSFSLIELTLALH